MRRTAVACILICLVSLHRYSAAVADYEVPNPAYAAAASYYSSATGTGTVLKNNLKTIISTGAHEITYGDARYAFAELDQDPNNHNNILLIYNRASVPATWDGSSYNREHLWCVSWLGISDPSNGYAGMASDLFELRPCASSINSSRSNNYFGTDNSSGSYRASGDSWYPGDADAGEIARSLFYMATRWADNGLTLTELTAIPPNASMQGGDLSSLLHWNYKHGVDNFERRRNQLIYTDYQNNRNPYIDHPEYVWAVFGGGNNNSQLSVGTVNPATGASSANVSLGRVIKNSTLGTTTVAMNKTGVDPTTYDITLSGDAACPQYGTGQSIDYNSQTRNLTVGLSSATATAGLKSGTIRIHNTDLTTGGAGQGSADGDDLINVTASVLDHASPSFNAGATRSALTLDFGTIQENSGIHSLGFSIFNLMQTQGYTAGLDLDSFQQSGSMRISSSLLSFSSLTAGGDLPFTVSLDTSSLGDFSANYVLNFSDENIPGAASLTPMTISVHGIVAIPEPAAIVLLATAAGAMWLGRKRLRKP